MWNSLDVMTVSLYYGVRSYHLRKTKSGRRITMSTNPAPVPVTSVGPITSGERILYIDVLRGMALFGILAANMRGFGAPALAYGNIGVLFPGRADVIAQGFIDIFIQGKF